MSDGVHAAITPRKNACTVSMHLVPTMGGVSDPFGRLLLIVHKVDLNTYADSSQIVAAKEKSQIFYRARSQGALCFRRQLATGAFLHRIIIPL
jgi:hypothetical protein